jgi:hypothetical protein
MKQSHPLLLLALLVYHAFTGSLMGQNLDSLLSNKRVYQAENIGELPLPKIDGLLDDEIWGLGEWQGEFTQQQPVGGAAPTEDTYVKVLYDESNMFVAIICQDDEPDLIRDIFDRRDALSGDMTGIAIDSYNDKLTAFEFNLSAAGQKMDLKHVGDYQWDFNWNAVWDGATARSDSGWVAEMKIPFSQMRYTNKEQHVWGMHVWRWIDRRQEEDQWQYIPLQAPAMVYLFGELKGVEQIRSSRQMEMLPYVSLSAGKQANMEDPDKIKINGGIDAKVGISSDFTLDLTINPDFGQVEADPSVLNLTAFETFYEEKRPFFLEGNEIFDFSLDGDIPYYSRRIGAEPSFPGTWEDREVSETHRWTTILGAAKLTGKTQNGLSVGVINGLTAEETGIARDSLGETEEIQIAPLSNYHASRVKKEFNQGNTIIGGMFSLVNRFSPSQVIKAYLPSMAVTGGLDFLHYWDNKNYYLEAKSIASQLRGSKEAILEKQLSHIHRFQRPDASYLEVDSLREQLSGSGGLVRIGKKGGKFNFSVDGQYRSPGINLNDMGFIRQADFVGEGIELAYRMNEPGNWVRNYTFSFSQEALWSFGGENTQNRTGLNFNLRTNKLWSFILSYGFDASHLDTRDLRGGPAIRVDGEHQAGAMIMSNSSKNFSGSLGVHYNNYVVENSHQEVVYAILKWLPIRRIKLSAKVTYTTRDYHQQYVSTLVESGETLYLSGQIDQQTAALYLRGELFITPELSIQYYGSPFYSVGKYSNFLRVNQSGAKNMDERFEALDTNYDDEDNRYSFEYNALTWSFNNPDFSFMQFRSNLVLRWEYNLGSTFYFVWAHDRSDWQGVYNPVSDITGDLFGIKGNHVFMLKLNFWFNL